MEEIWKAYLNGKDFIIDFKRITTYKIEYRKVDNKSL